MAVIVPKIKQMGTVMRFLVNDILSGLFGTMAFYFKFGWYIMVEMSFVLDLLHFKCGPTYEFSLCYRLLDG